MGLSKRQERHGLKESSLFRMISVCHIFAVARALRLRWLKIGLFMIVFTIMFASLGLAASTNVSLNYVYNGSTWVPWLSTTDGKPKIDLNLLNITAGNLSVSGGASIGSNTFYVDGGSNRVGIGTSTPSKTLEVNGSIKGYIASGTDSYLAQNTSTNDELKLISETDRYEIDIWDNSEAQQNDIITFLSTGNVGIGTTAPTKTLEVDGDSLVTGMMRQGNTWHAYGGFEDQAETVACGAGDWNHITNATNDLWTLDEFDGVSTTLDTLVIANGGDYFGTLSLSISALNGKDFHIRVYNNTQASAEGREIGISTTGAGNEMNVAVPIYVEGTTGDAIQFEIMSADGTDPVVDDGLFYFTYLHD